jgi:RNA polymerase sigma-70 factor (ECF subfamily)
MLSSKLDASAWVEPLISLLPKEYAIPLRLSDIEGLKQQEVAKRLGLSLSATKSRVQRARKLLKQKFEECGVIESNEYQSVSFTVTKPCCKGLVN